MRSASAAETSPFSTAFARMRSASSPRPSSDTRMTMLLPRWKASSEIVPCRGFPAASRTSGDSMPWSAALRMMWIIGSPNSSIIRLSSSVFSPLIVQADVLAVGPRDVADHAMEPAEQRPDRQHPHVHHALLNAVADAVEQVNRLEEIADAVAGLHRSIPTRRFSCSATRHAVLHGQLARQLDQLVGVGYRPRHGRFSFRIAPGLDAGRRDSSAGRAVRCRRAGFRRA